MEQESLDYLRAVLPQGSDVSTVVVHVSASGMTRDIAVLASDHGRVLNVSWAVSDVLGWRMAPNGRRAVRVRGAGMDMGFHLAHSLGIALYGDGYALQHQTAA